jgi:hypothetical protein
MNEALFKESQQPLDSGGERPQRSKKLTVKKRSRVSSHVVVVAVLRENLLSVMHYLTQLCYRTRMTRIVAKSSVLKNFQRPHHRQKSPR